MDIVKSFFCPAEKTRGAVSPGFILCVFFSHEAELTALSAWRAAICTGSQTWEKGGA